MHFLELLTKLNNFRDIANIVHLDFSKIFNIPTIYPRD